MEPKNCHNKTNKLHPTGFQTSTARQINFKRKPKSDDTSTRNIPYSQCKSKNLNDIPSKSQKIRSLKSAQIEYHNVRQNKMKRKEEADRKNEEIRTALNRYNQKKKYKNRKLLTKTSKGQPIMKNRIEILLEKIRSSMVE